MERSILLELRFTLRAVNTSDTVLVVCTMLWIVLGNLRLHICIPCRLVLK